LFSSSPPPAASAADPTHEMTMNIVKWKTICRRGRIRRSDIGKL